MPSAVLGSPTIGGPAQVRVRYLYPLYPCLSDFSEVRGMRAKVICTPDRFQILGDDRTDPGSLDPAIMPAVGTLTDVKVLLRRY